MPVLVLVHTQGKKNLVHPYTLTKSYVQDNELIIGSKLILNTLLRPAFCAFFLTGLWR